VKNLLVPEKAFVYHTLINHKENRYKVLEAVIEFTDRNTKQQFHRLDITKKLPFLEVANVESILDYFADKDYLNKGPFEWAAHEEGSNYLLTALGIDAYENWGNTNTQTPQMSVTNNITGSVGALQMGNQNVASVTQNVGFNPQELSEILTKLREEEFKLLSSEKHSEAEKYLQDIETEAKGNAEASKIQGAFSNLLGIAGHGANILALAQFLVKCFGVDIPILQWSGTF
jgi:hypothetical protein